MNTKELQAQQREKRLAEALRTNLLRRKAQDRARQSENDNDSNDEGSGNSGA